MVKFSIISTCANEKDIPYLVKELKQKNLIAGMERDKYGDTVYITHNLPGVKKIMEEYEGLILDIHKDK